MAVIALFQEDCLPHDGSSEAYLLTALELPALSFHDRALQGAARINTVADQSTSTPQVTGLSSLVCSAAPENLRAYPQLADRGTVGHKTAQPGKPQLNSGKQLTGLNTGWAPR